MAQNTEIKERGKLTIKYSPLNAISDKQADKLSRALNLACVYLAKSIKDITPICNGRNDVPNLVLDVLKYHFFQNPREKFVMDEFWRRDVIRIAHNLRRIHCGLHIPVVIKDAYASMVGGAVKKYSEDFRRDMLANAMMGLDMVPKDKFVEGWNRVRSDADAEAMIARGYVAPKKAVAQVLKQDGRAQQYKKGEFERGPAPQGSPAWMTQKNAGPNLAVRLAPDDLGSIHVNFKRMLREKDELSDSIVASNIIHEASHKFISTHDFAYTGDDDYERLERRQSLANADSYAYAVVSLGRDRLMKDDAAMKWADAGF